MAAENQSNESRSTERRASLRLLIGIVLALLATALLSVVQAMQF